MAHCGMLGESNTKTRMTPVCLQFIFLPSHWYPHSYSVINAGLKFDAFFTFRDTCHGLHWPIWPHCNGWGKTPLYVWSVLVGREDVMVTATVCMYDLRWLAGKTRLWLPLSVCMICACWQGRRDDDCHCLYVWLAFVGREDVMMTATVYMYDLCLLAGKTWRWLPLSIWLICVCWQGRCDDDCCRASSPHSTTITCASLACCGDQETGTQQSSASPWPFCTKPR